MKVFEYDYTVLWGYFCVQRLEARGCFVLQFGNDREMTYRYSVIF